MSSCLRPPQAAAYARSVRRRPSDVGTLRQTAGEQTTLRRPRWVWLISAYYCGMFVLSYSLLLLALSQPTVVPTAITALGEDLTPVEWAVLLLQSFIALSAAIALFFLRKEALYLFTAGFVIGFAWLLWHSLSVMAVTGMLILTAVCLYTRQLSKQGHLR